MTAEYKNNISFIIEVINCSELAFHQKIVWFESVAIGKLDGDRQADKTKKVVILIFFFLNFLQQNTAKIFFPVVRQSCPQRFLAFTLKQKDALGTKDCLQ